MFVLDGDQGKAATQSDKSWFKFYDGFSNAVRKQSFIRDFL